MRPGRRDIELLLGALRDPTGMLRLGPEPCDLLIRAARRAKLLATLRARLDRAGVLGHIDSDVARHLQGAHALFQYRQHMAGHLLHALQGTLDPEHLRVVLLKGSAYMVQALPLAEGRLFADVDILVARSALTRTEQRLMAAGWTSTVDDAYDQRYYREWSHELPPMTHPSHALSLDVHHTLLPVTGRVTVDSGALLDRTIKVADTGWYVLSPPDQLLHACVHLFQDSDCVDKLRDLVDVDMLVRSHGAQPAFWPTVTDLVRRSPGVGRSLWYALRYCTRWLETPVDPAALRELDFLSPGATTAALMDRAVHRVVFGPHPDARSDDPDAFWSLALKARAMHLRMPLRLLSYHVLSKTIRALRTRRAASGA